MYVCSECRKAIGWMNKEMFICPRTGRVATTIPKFPVVRQVSVKPRDIDKIDLSQRAKKRDKKDVVK